MTEQANTTTTVEAAKIDSPEMQCDMKVFLAANTFSERLISEVPELQAIAIIPLWSPKLDGVPTGLLRLRNETPPYIAGLLEMLGRITAFGVDVHKDMVAQLNAFDKMAGDLVMEIHTKTAELRDLNQKIEQLKSAIDNSEVSL